MKLIVVVILLLAILFICEPVSPYIERGTGTCHIIVQKCDNMVEKVLSSSASDLNQWISEADGDRHYYYRSCVDGLWYEGKIYANCSVEYKY